MGGTTSKTSRISWEEGVRRGRKLAAIGHRNKWAIADLALAVFPILPNRGIDKANRWTDKCDLPRTKMARWLDETGIELAVSSLSEYRQTANAWPVERRIAGASFSTHRLLRGHPQRFALLRPGMTYQDGEALTAQIRARSGSSFPKALRNLDASAGFLGTALKDLGQRSISTTQIEILGEHIARLEANLDALLERLDMSDSGPGLRLAEAA